MNIHVVLVRSEYSANVGSAARAMANMGAQRLILIDPQCPLDSRAKEMAAGAQAQLANATIYPSWNDFLLNESGGLYLALTRRGGRKRKVSPLKDKLRELAEVGAESLPSSIYLVFGPEADGLNAEDLFHSHFAVHLPVYGDFASLNLAQAVLLTLFIVRESFQPNELPEQTKGRSAESIQPVYLPDQLIKDWLTAMGFDIGARRSSAYLTLRRLFMQNLPTSHEVQVLEAILQQNIRKLKNLNTLMDRHEELIGLTPKDMTDNFSDITGKNI
jgi:TrmH family RNA methyltransferase